MGMNMPTLDLHHQMQLQRSRPHQNQIADRAHVDSPQPRRRQPTFRQLDIPTPQTIMRRQNDPATQRQSRQPNAVQPARRTASLQPKAHTHQIARRRRD